MRGIVYAILGILTGWLIWGLFTKDFETNFLFMYIFGLISGYDQEKGKLAG
ncbi:tRNA U-34 5-methylaminomethyl-2-thiouridine biosynthesis protein [Metabacillus sp. 113a]|uniref:tRNA U-34 5-methylaminomethyl-2-thiouridine biosynthesis protein n=1 Tax=Metabacillus sp. 113a TaxID=3404706 RepID=UPI003CF94C26